MAENEIHLYGTVGAGFWDEEFFTASLVHEMLKEREGDLTVRLNSGGGIASEGQAIYTALRDYPGAVNVVVDGVAASAASLIAMAGDTITMRRGSIMLIHDPALGFARGRGTAEDHRGTADFLDKLGDAYAEVYAYRSGKNEDEARAIMRAETLYRGAEAVTAGFATEYEGDKTAAAAAVFDYRIYANAPKELREASSGLDDRASLKAVAAFGRVGASIPKAKPATTAGDACKQKEPLMADPKETAAEVPTAKAGVVADVAPAPEMKAAPKAEKPEPATMSASQVAKLYTIAERLKVPNAKVAEVVSAHSKYEDALEMVTEAWSKAGDSNAPMPGAPTARILRDERDTMRAGMQDALQAQMARRDPTDDRARPFMGMSLVEMAASAAGYTGPLRTMRDREEALMAGTHSTSDFPAIFENALNKQLEARYREAEPTYRRIARRVTFNDFRPHPQVRVGDFPDLQDIAEGGEIKFGTLSEKKESVAVKSYGVALRISRQMMINDDMDALAQLIADRGRAVARFEDQVFYAMMLGGSNADGPTLLETSRQVFNTTDTTKAGSAAAITVPSLSTGRAAMMKQKSLDGALLNVMPRVLLVGPDKLTEAQQIVAPIQAQQAGSVNPFSGVMEVVATARITGNAWYLFADPADLPNFVYGFLSGFEAPRMRMDEPFGQQGMAFSVEHDFGVGAVDFRGGYKNAGA